MEKRANSRRNPEDSSCPRSQFDRKPIIHASSLSLKSVLLHDWWLVKSEGKGIAVAGFASTEKIGARVFSSTPISKRIDATTLETTDGLTITVSGFVNKHQTLQNGFPFLVCNRFHLGFPYDWEECVTQCYGEESAKRDATTRKPGLVEIDISYGTNANTSLPFPLDNLSATRLRDLVMCLPKDSESLSCDDILGKLRDNAFKHTPVAAPSDLESEEPNVTANEVNEAMKNCKKAKTDQMHIDGDDRILDPKDTETKELTQGKGVVTRSMYRSLNLRNKLEENLPSNSSVNCKNFRNKQEKNFSSNFSVGDEVSTQPSTPAANKNCYGGVVIASEKEVTEVPDTYKVRRSGRLNIRKNYTGMTNR